ncbi:MAG TPA: aldo/keto reductase, partial [Dehalococcoidia bacterium]|nr:aldo/keto reductase [Dehalococcoidia bacterium]
RVDLLQLHNPLGVAAPDGGLPDDARVEEVAGVMRGLVAEGLAGHAGFTGLGEPALLHRVIGARRFETVQSYFNVLNPSSGFGGVSGGALDFGGLIDAAAGAGMGVIAIRVMAAGALGGPGGRATPFGGDIVPGSSYAGDVERSEALTSLSRELGLESVTELGFRFVLAKSGVSTSLIGFSDVDQLEKALRWAERGPLPEDAVRRVLNSAQ